MKNLPEHIVWRSRVEAAIILGIGFISFAIAGYFDLMEKIVKFARHHESWEIDEIFTAIFFIGIAVLFLFIRKTSDMERYACELEEKNEKLIKATSEIKELQGILPICSSCKKIRDDEGYWHQVENYISQHSHAQFSHGVCPDCARTLYRESFDDTAELDKNIFGHG